MDERTRPRAVPTGPTGLGTAGTDIKALLASAGAERLRSYTHVPFKKVGPSLIPDFQMPFELRLSPHLDSARRDAAEWAHRMGILHEGVWDEDQLGANDVSLCAAGIYPDGSADEVALSSQWLTWGFYGDDYFPLVYGHRRDLAAARACTARLSACMPLDGEPPAAPANALERGLADLWLRTTAEMTPRGQRTLRDSVDVMTQSWLWELSNHLQNRVPDPVGYLEMRRTTIGSELTLNLYRLGHGPHVPEAVYLNGPVRSLENAAVDYGCLMNDVFSYQKEIEYEGEFHNGILVVQNFFGCDYPAALDVIHDLMTQRLQQFQHVATHELPILYDDFALSEQARRILDGYVVQLQDWIAGSLNYYRGCHRYGADDLARRMHGFLPDTTPSMPIPARRAGAVAAV